MATALFFHNRFSVRTSDMSVALVLALVCPKVQAAARFRSRVGRCARALSRAVDGLIDIGSTLSRRI